MKQDKEDSGLAGQWPMEWMDALPSALFLLRGNEVVQGNDRGRFLLGLDAGFEPFDWTRCKSFNWRKEDRMYFNDRWADVPADQRSPMRMELEVVRNKAQRFQCEMRLSPGPEGNTLLQLVDISEQRFRQQALQDREAHYRRLNDIAQEGIVLVQDNVVLDANSRFLVMMGVEHPEEVIGDTIKQLGFQRMGNLEPIVGSGVFDRADWTLTNKLGDVLHLDIGKGRLEDGAEVWMMYDVSDRKRIEFDLVQERERFRLLVQSSPNGIVILVDGLIRYSNPVADTLFGRQADELEGQRFGTLFPENMLERVEEGAKQARQGRNVEEWEVELEPGGTRVMLKWRLTIFDGQPAVQVNLSDVTDRYSLMQERIRAEVAEEANQQLTQQIEQRIAAEAALKDATARMRSIVESGEDFMIWTEGAGHRVTSGNVNFLSWMGLSKWDAAGCTAALGQTVVASGALNGFDVEDRFDRALQGRPQRFEWAVSGTTEEDRVWLQLFLNPIESPKGNPELSAIAYDITERKRIDRRIRDALKEKEILLQEVHHRVKNNLQIIHSILNLQKKFVNDEKTIIGLEEIQNRVSTMSIIHETLYQNTDVSRIGFPSYITRIAGNIIQGYRSETAVRLVTELEDIQAPLDQAIPCGLILNEWVSNAMKYAFEGREEGTITVRLEGAEVEGAEDQEEIRIEVRDDGVGLPEGFEWSNRDSLGLYLVQALAEQLDAELTAETDGGTRFLISFRRPKNLFDGY